MKRPTIIDVAKLAGVSKATVARVVSGNQELVREETRQRVLDAAQKLGYERNTVASSMRSNRTFMVALCIPDITNPFWPEVARGVQDTIEEADYTVATVNSDWQSIREQNYLRRVRQNQFDGLIINPTGVTNSELLDLGVPVVILGSGDNYPAFDSVGSDTESGVQEALNHLLDLGHRRIGLIEGLSARTNYSARHHGYVAFHAKNQLPLDENLIIKCEFSDQGGYDAMQQVLSLDSPPTAIFAANDILAIGALKAAQTNKLRVPRDISIVGMDDIHAAATTSPALTTIAKPKYENGSRAAQFLLERMAGNEPYEPRHIKTPCALVIRESTAFLKTD